jgi:TonB family protein
MFKFTVVIIFVSIIGCSQSSQLNLIITNDYAIDTVLYHASDEVSLADTVSPITNPANMIKCEGVLEYPVEARRANLSGTVWLRALIGSDGDVLKAVVLQTDNDIFNKPALRFIMHCKYNPVILNGKTAAWIKLPMRYRLN